MIDKTCFSWIQLIKKSDLPANAKYICFYLSTFMNLEHDVAWPSQVRIASETGLTEPTVRKWLEYLADNEWLVIRRKAREVLTNGGNQLQNEYIISIPDIVLQRAVNDLPTNDKGGLINHQRGVNESSKVGKQFTPNNNSNNNKNIHTSSQDSLVPVLMDKSWMPNTVNMDWLTKSGLPKHEISKVIDDFRDFWILSKSKRKNWDLSFRKNPVVNRAVNTASKKKPETYDPYENYL